MGPVRATTGFRDVSVYGRALGGEALRCLSLLEARTSPPCPLPWLSPARWWRSPAGPCRTPPSWRSGGGTQDEIRDAPDDATRKEAIAAYRRVAEPLRLARLGTGPVRLEVQAVRLGEALIVACEGELFVEYGARLKDASPADVTFVAAYSNGYEGYIPTPAPGTGGLRGLPGPWTRVGRDGGTSHRARRRPRPSSLGRRA